MAIALLDSSAVVAYLLQDDALHADAAEAIEGAVRGGLTLAVSAVSWSELLHGALLGRYPDEAVREFAEDLGVEVVPVDVHVAEQGAALQAAYGRTGKRRELRRLRTPDALILGTAARYQEIELVICGDGQWTSVPGVDTDIALLQER